MLILFSKIAQQLHPYLRSVHLLLMVLIVFLITQFIPALKSESIGDTHTVLSFLLCLWLLLVHTITVVFNDFPDLTGEQASRFKRYKIKLQRAGYYILALVFTLLTLVITFLTFRLINVL
ncbi:hypothetical protein [Colwellia asteriadis]|uniref:hypothetical protein n=1 Tax=Colwellia asteriadis TaxID=517723 RepID=UPI0031E2095F